MGAPLWTDRLPRRPTVRAVGMARRENARHRRGPEVERGQVEDGRAGLERRAVAVEATNHVRLAVSMPPLRPVRDVVMPVNDQTRMRERHDVGCRLLTDTRGLDRVRTFLVTGCERLLI